MRRAALFLAGLAVLSACAAANDAANAVARDRAKTVITSVVAQRFPGVNAAPVTDCIIDAASAGEILNIASASATGVTRSTVEEVLAIASRPEAVNCIAEQSIKLLAG